MEALSAQLSAVMAEKCSLESRQGMLENVLAMREKQLDAAGQQVDPVEVKPPQVCQLLLLLLFIALRTGAEAGVTELQVRF